MNMKIDEHFINNVAFVGYRKEGQLDWRGTAFLVGTPAANPREAFQYFVTAKHVIEQIYRHAADKKILLRVNHRNADAQTSETELKDWIFHPTDSQIDVAIVPIALGPQIEMTALPLATFKGPLPNWIGVGTEIFFPGLFYPQTGERRNLPVLRRGSISTLPTEKLFLPAVGSINAYLIEARSIGGLSGSPVLAYRSTPTGRFDFEWEVHWIGLMHGHFDTTAQKNEGSDVDRRAERVNMGLAIVVPATDVLEVIYQPNLIALRRAAGAPD